MLFCMSHHVTPLLSLFACNGFKKNYLTFPASRSLQKQKSNGHWVPTTDGDPSDQRFTRDIPLKLPITIVK